MNPYDLTVYQVGNSSHHDYLWPYLFRYPGLTVLHDAHLHHARAAPLLRTRRAADYRAEFAANHPDVSPGPGRAGDRWIRQPPVLLLANDPARGRGVAAHGRARTATGARLDGRASGRRDHVDPPCARHADFRGTSPPLAGARARHYGFTDAGVVFGVFGGLTPEKRIPQILEAFECRPPLCARRRTCSSRAPRPRHYDVAADVRERASRAA